MQNVLMGATAITVLIFCSCRSPYTMNCCGSMTPGSTVVCPVAAGSPMNTLGSWNTCGSCNVCTPASTGKIWCGTPAAIPETPNVHYYPVRYKSQVTCTSGISCTSSASGTSCTTCNAASKQVSPVYQAQKQFKRTPASTSAKKKTTNVKVTPVTDDSLLKDPQIPAQKVNPVKESVPVEEPVTKQEVTPVKESAPVEEPAPVKESAPVEEPAPVKESTPAEEPAPAEEAIQEIPEIQQKKEPSGNELEPNLDQDLQELPNLENTIPAELPSNLEDLLPTELEETPVAKPTGNQVKVRVTKKSVLKEQVRPNVSTIYQTGTLKEQFQKSYSEDFASAQRSSMEFSATKILQATQTLKAESGKASNSNTDFVFTSWEEPANNPYDIQLTAGEEMISEETVTEVIPDEVNISTEMEVPAVLPERPSYAQPADEYIIDSSKKASKKVLPEKEKVRVGKNEVETNWEADQMNDSGTFIYYNNTQGRATVQTPDPVYIYAPRFRAVRQITDLNIDEQVMSTGDIYTPTEVMIQGRNTGTDTTKQNTQVGTQAGKTAMIQTRGTDGAGTLDGAVAPQSEEQEAVIAQENRGIAGPNVFDGKTRALTADGLIEVSAWTQTDDVRVFIDKKSASVAIRNESAPSLFTVQEGEQKQDVRIYKVASKNSAKPGETVDFIIYFENTGRVPVGNITLVDNLPARLEIIEDSAESSVDSSFTYEINATGSQTLRWEITQPLYAGEKGAVKFKALVR